MVIFHSYVSLPEGTSTSFAETCYRSGSDGRFGLEQFLAGPFHSDAENDLVLLGNDGEFSW
jgi:hypothetical protein